jgi:SHS2 domain-containing protein
MKNQAVLFGFVLLLVSAVAYGVVAVAEDSIPARSFEYPPETVSAVQTMSTEVHAGSKTSQQQQQQQQQKESETTTAEKDSVKEGSEPAAVHTNFARTSSRTAREDATTSSTSTTAGVTQEAKLSGDKEVKPNNYPNFEFTTGSTVKVQEEPSDATTEKASASNGAQEEKSTAEVKPNNYPNFEFTQQSKVDSKQTTQEAATSTEPEQSTSNVVPEEVKPNNYPNFEFKQTKEQSKQTTEAAAASTEPEQSTSNVVPEEVKPNNYPNFEFKQTKEESKQTTEAAAASTEPEQSTSNLVPEEVKPNNYPNFEFKQTKEESKQTTDEVSSTEGKQQSSSATPEEVKPNNYPNFEFKQSSSSSQSASAAGSRNLPFVNGYDEQEAKKFGAQFGQASATESKDKTTSSHTVDQSTTSAAVLSSEKTVASSSSESQSSSTDTSAFWTDIPTATYRGSDPSGKYPSSFDLTNARKNGASSSSSTSYRGSDPSGRSPSSFDLTNTRYQTQQQTQQQQQQQQQQHADSFQPDTELFTNFQPDDGQQFFARNPSLVPDQSAYRFGDTTSRTSSSSSSATQDLSKTSTSFGDNQFQTQDPVDQSVYSQFTNSRPSSSSKINEAGPDTKATTTGCSTSSYWSTHTESWPKFFVSTRSLVTDAFGTRAGTAYGTTTMLQALNDGRFDAFSELANHGVAALLNAYTKPTSYQFSHTVVIDQFNRALVSRTAAAVQAKVFENANNAYGTENCKA